MASITSGITLTLLHIYRHTVDRQRADLAVNLVIHTSVESSQSPILGATSDIFGSS
jgi:hypothetical protein